MKTVTWKGTPMVFSHNKWRYICASAEITSAVAQKICAQVGLSEGKVESAVEVEGGDRVRKISNCAGEGWLQTCVAGEDSLDCDSVKVVQITCGNVDEASQTMWGAKLVTEERTFTEKVSGRLEVRHLRKWGTVCHDSFD